MALEEGTDAEFGGESLGQLVLGEHGWLEVFQTVLGNKEGVGKVEKWGHAVALGFGQFGAKRAEERLNGTAVIGW